MIKRKIIVFLVFIIIGLSVVFIHLKTVKKESNMIINVENFDVEYDATGRKVSIDDINSIDLGSSIYEISEELGEPNTWIGSGLLRPVYFLEGNKVAVFHFKYPRNCKDLKQIVVVNEYGEMQIMKER